MLLTIEDLKNLCDSSFAKMHKDYHGAMNQGDLQSIAMFQKELLEQANQLIEKKKRVIAKGILAEIENPIFIEDSEFQLFQLPEDDMFEKPLPPTDTNKSFAKRFSTPSKRNKLLLILVFLFATLFASCGNDNATATVPATDTATVTTTKIDTQAICGNYCKPYIKQILELKQERDSLETLLNAFVEQTMRLQLKGTPDFYTKPKTTVNKKQNTTGVPKQKYTYVGQVYRGKKGGLFQVYLDDTGKRQKHYISSAIKKQQIIDSGKFIDVSRETINDFELSERIPVK